MNHTYYILSIWNAFSLLLLHFFFNLKKSFVLGNWPSFSVCVPVKIEVNPMRALAQNRQSILNGLMSFAGKPLVKVAFGILQSYC